MAFCRGFDPSRIVLSKLAFDFYCPRKSAHPTGLGLARREAALRRVDVQGVRVLPRRGLSGIGGAMPALQVGFMSPSFVGIVPSIEMVIFAAAAAVAGRRCCVRHLAGQFRQDLLLGELSGPVAEMLMAALFMGVVMAFPNGLAGLYESHVVPWLKRRRACVATRSACRHVRQGGGLAGQGCRFDGSILMSSAELVLSGRGSDRLLRWFQGQPAEPVCRQRGTVGDHRP